MPDTIAGSRPIALTMPVRNVLPRLIVHSRPETISNCLRMQGTWQFQIVSFITGYLTEGDVFVDIGANIGYFSVYAGLRVGSSGKVHAIEPDEDNVALLRANLQLNRLTNIQVHQLAVSDNVGEATLFRDGFNAGAHSLLPKDVLVPGPIVPVTRLDNLLEGERLPKLIKIDVQGAEMAVLRGATQLMSSDEGKPAIILEFSPLELQRNGHLTELFDFIAGNNYSLRAFIANDRGTTTPPRVRRSTLREIADNLLAANDAAEFDLLLLPRS